MSDSSIKSAKASDVQDSAVQSDVEKGPEPTTPQRAIRGWRWCLVVIVMLSSIFLFSLDNTVVADLVPILVTEFDAVDQLTWLSVGFTIGAVVLALSWGKVYATFDTKWLFIGSTLLFEAASALCGAAPNISAEIVGRVLAGVGGNGMYLGTLTLAFIHTLDTERPLYLASIGILWGLGTVLGPVVGGGFAKVDWRWAFYINPIIGAFQLVICYFLIPSTDPAPGIPLSTRFARFDYIGSVLITGAITTFVMATNVGGTMWSWGSGPSIALFVVAGVLILAFAIQQGFKILTRYEDRVFPVQFLWNKDAVLLFICAAASNTAAFVPIYYIPIYFQFTRGDTPLESAVRLLPLIFLLSATVFTNGQVMSKWGSFQDWYIGGNILIIIGGALFSRITAETSTSAIYGYEALLALGSGAIVQAGYTVIYLFIKPEESADGVSFMTLGQLGGIAIGLSVCGAVFLNRAIVSLQPLLPDMSRVDIQRAVSGTSSSVFLSLPEETRKAALDVIVKSLTKVFIPVYAAGAVGLICCVFIKRKNIGRVMAGLE
ncbi:hypothetical protein BFW01_g10315 [Lasiodiplodia theobromae]|uniref:Efflux pump patC n=1 Tax=Lasiodiplodia theobromae TaxID=45133 RepID=A0A5N5D504_9PEZI|nr:Efflux pump patC [Lasiodiplodia theobromae]KAF9629112.1 hypothetical protein BFW01_g10315 [Lasiodiplodia theobromae]